MEHHTFIYYKDWSGMNEMAFILTKMPWNSVIRDRFVLKEARLRALLVVDDRRPAKTSVRFDSLSELYELLHILGWPDVGEYEDHYPIVQKVLEACDRFHYGLYVKRDGDKKFEAWLETQKD
jgi:hypothetical protein